MENTTCLIPLTQGQSAIVSPEDFEYLMQFRWHVQKRQMSYGFLWYAKRYAPETESGMILMHHVIALRAGLPEWPQYDHKDRNGLNNTRNNLRLSNRRLNNVNRNKSAGKSSAYVGVSFHKATGKWQASIRFNGKKQHLGLYATEIEAAAVYVAFAIFYYNDHAPIG